jgi:Ca2+-binding EF-hand superfamily protein
MKPTILNFSALIFVAATSATAFAQTAPQAAPNRLRADKVFSKIDNNGDGKISRDEVAARPHLAKNFDRIDVNKDGFMTRDEMIAMREKRDGRVLSRMDTDRDGKLSRDETKNRPKLAENFDRIDTNRDGFLSKEELIAAHKARGQRQF